MNVCAVGRMVRVDKRSLRITFGELQKFVKSRSERLPNYSQTADVVWVGCQKNVSAVNNKLDCLACQKLLELLVGKKTNTYLCEVWWWICDIVGCFCYRRPGQLVWILGIKDSRIIKSF